MNRTFLPSVLVASLCSVGVWMPSASFAASPGDASANVDWPVYLGGKSRSLYSPLQQINRDNVSQLQVAWTYDTGDKGEYQSNNLIVGGVLYTATPTRKVVALDAATGKELWKWDPVSERPGGNRSRERGLVFWQNESGGEGRIFTGVGNYLYALDTKTGQPIRNFGQNGSIHLGTGLDVEGLPAVGLNTPGVTYKDMLIIGGFGGPGAMRAFDVHTGERRWIFHLIPRPGDVGYDTWPPEAYKTATGLMPWCGQSLDEQRGILYVATKTAEPDFYGGERHGDNLFANCLVALDANTGKRLWHFQIVHHDLLDRDLPCPPVLITVMHDGKKVDAVAQGTKQGLLFVFDRVTGHPLWPIEEKPGPQSELRGEQASPTQPFPTKPVPLTREFYKLEDISTISPDATLATVNKVQSSPNVGPFPAPSIKELIMFPGFDGGMEWGGGAADPNGIYYVNVNEMPWIMQMVETRNPDGTPIAHGKREYMLNCAACHGLDFTGNPQSGFPTLVDIAKRKTRDQMVLVTKQGAGRMPAFDRLSEGDRNAILDYILGVTPPPATSGRADEAPAPAAKGRKEPPYAFAGFHRFLDKEGYPAIKPPWGTLNAVDLNTGEIKWKVPLGEYKALTQRGLPPTGTENYGGPVVTAGGLLFIGATADETFRAFDKDTGKILWQAALPFGGDATPSTYTVKGRQYVVISAGGAKSGRPAGGSIVAFALPEAAAK
ncbi:Pyrrolo-quinoline quinone [Chthoniobacter flavus Ellin428]|uniref:Pyrrolo-quinoline quinone n=1 Tax=Chthoniobacter flavus Ellin428 TaxID=497964 RepID=B4CZN2_9BACT|nr:PQQ-binding-like beta-propeller repeat protein [Chthoniobacter flavus]EDY20196.1 Pyrrolo-quinoline quinone [Chthoniobacter flavus Ellin428]TCO94093.1 quinoprotein glucose dehydrogenase [Chthoniobacter flavus]